MYSIYNKNKNKKNKYEKKKNAIISNIMSNIANKIKHLYLYNQ